MKKIDSFYIWGFWIIYLEIIYKSFVLNNLLSLNTISVIFFSLIWILILFIFTSLFKERINKILAIIILSFLIILTLAQIVYFNIYNSIFSFFSLTTGTGQVLQFGKIIIDVIFRIWYVFLIVIIPFILFLKFNNKFFSYKRISLKNASISLVSMVFVLFGLVVYININSVINKLIYSTYSSILTINKTGLLTMEIIDTYRYFFGFEEKMNYKEKYIIDDNELYNVYNINFDELINRESNERIKLLYNYFDSVKPTKKNEYTGLFKNKNLILITAESFDTIAIDKDITPTLYKLSTNGVKFENYYQPIYPISTSDGEYMILMSLIPQEGTWSFSKTSNLNMKYAIGNMFKNYDYLTYAFHNHDYNFYNRSKSHTNIGFNFIGCGNGLEEIMNCNNWPSSDYEMIESTIDYYIDSNKPFLTYYMTVSGHLNYDFNSNDMVIKNKKEVENLDYSNSIKSYYATHIELDKALELLINELERKNILDDTLIIISPDHYPYGLNTKQLNEVSEYNKCDKFEKFHTSLIMYNPKLENIVIEDTISSLDILPTIYNLFGIEYDSRFYVGKDIFSDDDHIVIFSDRSWITNKGKYDSIKNKFISNSDEEVNKEYIDMINEIVSDKFSVSSTILDTNFYERVKYYAETED